MGRDRIWVRRSLGLLAVAAAAGAATAEVGQHRAAAAGQETVTITTLGPSCTSTFCYVPALLSARRGDTVTWSNSSPDFHTVTRCTAAACAGQGPGTGTDSLDSGGNIAPLTGAYSHTFTGPGTYVYYCSIHGYSVMHGEVDVASGSPCRSRGPHTC